MQNQQLKIAVVYVKLAKFFQEKEKYQLQYYMSFKSFVITSSIQHCDFVRRKDLSKENDTCKDKNILG